MWYMISHTMHSFNKQTGTVMDTWVFYKKLLPRITISKAGVTLSALLLNDEQNLSLSLAKIWTASPGIFIKWTRDA